MIRAKKEAPSVLDDTFLSDADGLEEEHGGKKKKASRSKAKAKEEEVQPGTRKFKVMGLGGEGGEGEESGKKKKASKRKAKVKQEEVQSGIMNFKVMEGTAGTGAKGDEEGGH